MNPTFEKRIDMQVAQRQTTAHNGVAANFLRRKNNSSDLLRKFHKNESVWIRARRRVLQ